MTLSLSQHPQTGDCCCSAAKHVHYECSRKATLCWTRKHGNLPKLRVLQGTKFATASQEDMRYLFQYLEVCLGKIVADNEVGALVQALAGGYVEPGPGGDPIRWPVRDLSQDISVQPRVDSA